MTRWSRSQGKGRSGEVRPTTSRVLSALFSMFGPGGVEGQSVLDLYAGTGGFGLEALRRGAKRVVMVEINRRRCEELRAKASDSDRLTVVCGDAVKALRTIEGPFDVVFADPPYADNPFEMVAAEIDRHDLLERDGVVLLEHFHKTELPGSLKGLELSTRRRYGDAAVSVYRPTRSGTEPMGPAGKGA